MMSEFEELTPHQFFFFLKEKVLSIINCFDRKKILYNLKEQTIYSKYATLRAQISAQSPKLGLEIHTKKSFFSKTNHTEIRTSEFP